MVKKGARGFKEDRRGGAAAWAGGAPLPEEPPFPWATPGAAPPPNPHAGRRAWSIAARQSIRTAGRWAAGAARPRACARRQSTAARSRRGARAALPPRARPRLSPRPPTCLNRASHFSLASLGPAFSVSSGIFFTCSFVPLSHSAMADAGGFCGPGRADCCPAGGPGRWVRRSVRLLGGLGGSWGPGRGWDETLEVFPTGIEQSAHGGLDSAAPSGAGGVPARGVRSRRFMPASHRRGLHSRSVPGCRAHQAPASSHLTRTTGDPAAAAAGRGRKRAPAQSEDRKAAAGAGMAETITSEVVGKVALPAGAAAAAAPRKGYPQVASKPFHEIEPQIQARGGGFLFCLPAASAAGPGGAPGAGRGCGFARRPAGRRNAEHARARRGAEVARQLSSCRHCAKPAKRAAAVAPRAVPSSPRGPDAPLAACRGAPARPPRANKLN